MKIILSLLLLIISVRCFSQTTTTFYFNKDLNIVSQEDAVFRGTGEMDSNLYKLTCYNMLPANPVFMAHFTDSTFHIFQGLFRSYYPDGRTENEGVYNNGKEEGLWKKKDRNGNLLDSTWYANGQKESSTTYAYYPDQHLEREVTNDSKNNRYRITFYDESGKVVENDAGNDDTDKVSVFTKVEIEAAFPGGPGAWARYVSLQIEKHIDEFAKSDYGTCLVRFIVDTSGNVSEVQAKTMVGTKFAKVATETIIHGPKWIPAQVNGRKVKAYRIQPLTLTSPDQ